MNIAELTASLDRIPRIWRTAKPLSDDEVVEWHRTLSEFPAATLSKVMDGLAKEAGRDWPPHLPELASRCRNQSRATSQVGFVACGACCGSGWTLPRDEHGLLGPGGTAVYCRCPAGNDLRHRHQGLSA